MAGDGEVVLRLRICYYDQCRATFFVCASCDHGQRYCSGACRDQARRHQKRRANQRYQQSPEGRLDHRDREREYRRRQAQTRVTDQGSLLIISSSSSECGPFDASTVEIRARSGEVLLPVKLAERPPVRLCCQICGRMGRFVDPFPQIPRRR